MIQISTATAATTSVGLKSSAATADVLSISSRRVVPEKIIERFQSIPFASQQLEGLFAERMKVNVELGLLHIDEALYLSGFVSRPAHPITEDQTPGAAWVGEHIGR